MRVEAALKRVVVCDAMRDVVAPGGGGLSANRLFPLRSRDTSRENPSWSWTTLGMPHVLRATRLSLRKIVSGWPWLSLL